jgi:hypothetical protein
MVDRLGLLPFLLDIAREYWLVGDVYIWHEWDPEIEEWEEVYILPAEYCHTILHPFLRRKELILFARPLVDTASVRRMTDRDLYMIAGDPDVQRLVDEIDEELPEDLKELLDYGEGQPLNTDPSKGSYVFHLSRNRPPNEAYGKGLVERCLETLLRLENLKNAQLQISSRNMAPIQLIHGEALSQDELDDLRLQVDLALLESVDYPIVTNYPVTWDTIGANERLLNVETEYDTLREDLATGLGTTRDILTGQATYGGQRMTLELMNTQYMTFRELIKDYVERGIFQPIAEAKGHYHYEEIDTWVRTEIEDLEPGDDVIQEYDGGLRKRKVQINKVYNHSLLRYNRLSIRDNNEVYEQLFQLHQKGSLALRYLLDLHNIDEDENAAALTEDMGTVKDPNMNRLIEAVYGLVADDVVSRTNFSDKVIEGLNLDVQSQLDEQPTPGTAPGDIGGLGGGIDMMDNIAPAPMGPDMGMGMGGPDMGMGGDAALPGAPAPVPPVGGPVSSRRLSMVRRTLHPEDVEKLIDVNARVASMGENDIEDLLSRQAKKREAKAKKDREKAKQEKEHING